MREALEALAQAASRSDRLADWRTAARRALDRLGTSPRDVRETLVLRVERLRALLWADDERRREADPLVEPAEPGAAAVLREAVNAANLYIDTDPFLAGTQRRMAHPEARVSVDLVAAADAEADLERSGLADPELLDELREGREVAEADGAAGARAQEWMNASWHNVAVGTVRRALEAARQLALEARDGADDAALRAQVGIELTVEDARSALERAGLLKKLGAASRAAGRSAVRIWQHAEPEIGKGVGQAVRWSLFLFLASQLPFVSSLLNNPSVAKALARLLTP